MTVSIEVCASDLSRFFFKSHFPQFLLDIVVVSKSSKCSAKKNIKKRSSTHTHSRLDPRFDGRDDAFWEHGHRDSDGCTDVSL